MNGEMKRDMKENQIKRMNRLIELLKANYNLILTGAPGTGKSYSAKQIAKQMIGKDGDENEQYEFVQFHPSYDYTDFVEGLRPTKPNDAGSIGFKLEPGIFKKFCEKARKAEFKQSGGVDNFDEAWDKFIEKVEEKDENAETYNEVKTLNGFDMNLRKTDSGVKNIATKADGNYYNKEQCYNVYRGLPGVPKRGLDNYRKAVVKHLKETKPRVIRWRWQAIRRT